MFISTLLSISLIVLFLGGSLALFEASHKKADFTYSQLANYYQTHLLKKNQNQLIYPKNHFVKKGKYSLQIQWPLNFKNNDGSTSLIGLMSLLLFSGIFLVSNFRYQKVLTSLKNRNQTYLCFKFQQVSQEKYLQRMLSANKKIFWLHKAKLASTITPKARMAIETTIKALMSWQQIQHFSYLKKIFKNKYCNYKQSFQYSKNLPFSSTGNLLVLKRHIDQTIELKKNNFSYQLFNKEFILQSQLKIPSHTESKFTSTEKEIAVLGQLKTFIGWQ